jgi:hypothetical protein
MLALPQIRRPSSVLLPPKAGRRGLLPPDLQLRRAAPDRSAGGAFRARSDGDRFQQYLRRVRGGRSRCSVRARRHL